MSSLDWNRIERLFIDAAATTGDARERLLTSAALEDEELRRVRDMLRAHDASEEFLVPPATGAPEVGRAGSAATTDDDRLPDQLGAYRIVRRLASGGMGTVYEAEQENPARRIALKVVRNAIASPELLRRLSSEAATLARMQHPGIAQVYSAGVEYHNGWPLPYIAMELIEGALPITEHARERSLNLQAKLDLFVQVCDAVHHGHQRGVIHRDLKPANILVSASGQPRIIDFGVARLIDPDVAATVATAAGDLIGTLAYMSPEQCSPPPEETIAPGQSGRHAPALPDLDVRSDVYSLGVVLYELLTEELPYPVRSARLSDAVRMICEQPARPPSALNPALRGDLETIILMTLGKDRTRRYGSASELAADIRRQQRGLPVEARPASRGYRARLFVRRHRAGVAAAGLVVAAMVGATVASTTFALETRKAMRAEAQERAHREIIADFLRLALTSADPDAVGGRGQDYAVKDLLDEASARLLESASGHALADAEIHEIIGATYRSLGIFDLSEQHLRTAHSARMLLLGPDDGLTLRTAGELGVVLRRQSRNREAEAIFADTLERQERRFGPRSPAVLATVNNLALARGSLGRHDEAATMLRDAYASALDALGPEHATTMSITNNLAGVLEQLGRLEEAKTYYRHSLEQRRQTFGDEHPRTLTTRNNLGLLLIRMERVDEAAEELGATLEMRRRVLGPTHPSTLTTSNNLAMAFGRLGQLEEAAAIYREVLSARLEVLGEAHENSQVSMNNLARSLERLNQMEEALALYRRALDLAIVHRGPRHGLTLNLRENLAGILFEAEEFTEAEVLLRELLADVSIALPAGHWRRPMVATRLGRCLLRQGLLDEAESILLEAHDQLLATHPLEHARLQSNIVALVYLYETRVDEVQRDRFQAMLR